jgi:thiamine thiazole synthase
MNPYRIAPIREAEITRGIARAWSEQFQDLVQSDVLIVGSGPSGLVCGMDLARAGRRVVLVEQMNHLGGGFWNGGYLMNKATIAAPAQLILEEVGVPCKQIQDGLYLVDAPHAVAKLIGAACDAGVKVLNLTKVIDVILRNGRLEGVVVNWAPVEAMGHDAAHVDPIGLEAAATVDATGHDAAVVALLSRRKLFAPVPGNGPMWVERSEQEVLDRTGEVFPGLFVVGLSVAAVHGTPRMGPAFGSMLLSGRLGAAEIGRTLATKP